MRTKLIRTSAVAATFALICGALWAPLALSEDDGETVNVYSARKEALILPILERFQEETGIEFHLVTGKADALLKRLQLEGEATPADVFITVDAGRLHRAKEAGVLQTIASEAVDATVPAHLRDADGYWVALSKRARTVMYARDRVDPAALSTYEGLADPMWEGRICIRSSGNIYNQSLVASMIEAIGAERTEAWAEGLVANFAHPPAGGDTDQLRAAAAGECDLAVANTYYFGRLAASAEEEDRAVAAALEVFWPNQGEGERGAHVNVSGVGITAHAQNRESAVRLIEFLVSPEAQSWYAEVNHEYPVVPGVPASATLESFGAFTEDTLNLTALGANNRKAVELMDRAGWR